MTLGYLIMMPPQCHSNHFISPEEERCNSRKAGAEPCRQNDAIPGRSCYWCNAALPEKGVLHVTRASAAMEGNGCHIAESEEMGDKISSAARCPQSAFVSSASNSQVYAEV